MTGQLETAIAGPLGAWAVLNLLTHQYDIQSLVVCVAALYFGRHWYTMPGHAALSSVVTLIAILSCSKNVTLRNVLWDTDLWMQHGTLDQGISPLHNKAALSISDTHGYAILTREAQALIHSSQSKCNAGRMMYEIFAHPYGMGSEQHWHAGILARAIEDDALFVWGDTACTHSGGAHCSEWYLPEHNCSREELGYMRKRGYHDGERPPRIIPSKLLALLPASFTRDQAIYWWNTQAIAGYLMRFKPSVFPPLPVKHQGTINVHLRSGDKVSESKLTPPEGFVDAALNLIQQQPLAYSRVLFITSDSSSTLARARLYATKHDLAVVYSTDVPRTAFGYDQQKVTDPSWDRNAVLAVLQELRRTTLYSEAWVGTRSSNWNRLIDMHRCINAPKCMQPFVEAGDSPAGKYDAIPAQLWYGDVV